MTRVGASCATRFRQPAIRQDVRGILFSGDVIESGSSLPETHYAGFLTELHHGVAKAVGAFGTRVYRSDMAITGTSNCLCPQGTTGESLPAEPRSG
jgi:hypothetical protein